MKILFNDDDLTKEDLRQANKCLYSGSVCYRSLCVSDYFDQLEN